MLTTKVTTILKQLGITKNKGHRAEVAIFEDDNIY